jgi:hypothetical protein
MRRNRVVFFVFVGVTLAALRFVRSHPNIGTSPRDAGHMEVNAATARVVSASVAQSTDFTDEQKQLFANAMARAETADVFRKEARHKNVSTLIDEQRAFEAAQRDALQNDERNLKILRESIVVVPLSMAVIEDSNGSKSIRFEFAAQNTSAAEIRSWSGTMKFLDASGHEIDAASLKITQTLKPGEKRTAVDSESGGSFRFVGKTLKEMTPQWNPTSIVFANGQRVERVPGIS